MTVFQFPTFVLEHDPNTGGAYTRFPDETWSGCEPVPDDAFHADALGITPAQHRLAHELAHHIVGMRVLGWSSSPIVWRDAHHEPQPDPDPDNEEWLVTGVTYLAWGKTYDPGVEMDLGEEAQRIASYLHDLVRLADTRIGSPLHVVVNV